jgi:hypothetical protein
MNNNFRILAEQALEEEADIPQILHPPGKMRWRGFVVEVGDPCEETTGQLSYHIKISQADNPGKNIRHLYDRAIHEDLEPL